MAFHTSSSLFAIHKYNVDHYYEPYKSLQYPDDIPPPLHHHLAEIDPTSFPSRSQARRAIQHGRLIVLRDDQSIIVNQTTTLQDDDILAIRSRVASEFYPQSITKYVEPPSSYSDIQSSNRRNILYEDEHIAIVNKPEGIDTIGEKRLDLQSVLPFILHPPPSLTNNNYLPRPIHRLDRKTSGCVLIAKSELAMKKFSIMFANREIQKSYCAVVFGEPTQDEHQRCIDIDDYMYSTIDYPIDGKDALTLWRNIRTVESPTWGTLSLLHLKPRSGKYHQIRRHLSYCLSCPIVGDAKYDGGSALAKESRKLGMFLCSNSIQFNHLLLEDESTVSVNIHLPDKFYELLNLDKDDVLI